MFYDSRIEQPKGYNKVSLIAEWLLVLVILLFLILGIWLVI